MKKRLGLKVSEETYKFFEQQKENYYWIDADDFTSQKLENGMNGYV